MICPLHAWGDESIRQCGSNASAYLLGASVVDTDVVGSVREALDSLRPTRGKLHWHDLNPRERSEVTKQISQLDARHLVVVATPMDLRREERARARCLERLTWELGIRDVTRLTLEARSRRLMERDLHVIRALRGRLVVAPSLRVEHGDPRDDAMLWLPDQILGAFGSARAERRPVDERIAATLETFDIEP